MIRQNQPIKKTIGLMGAICGSLIIGLPALAQMNPTPGNINQAPDSNDRMMQNTGDRDTINQSLQPTGRVSPLNPCPSVFYEPQHVQRGIRPPEGCPAVLPGTQPVPQQPASPSSGAIPESGGQETTPAPEQLQSPASRVIPMNGMVSVKLVNQTGDPITYQVIGDTTQRQLQGRSDATLEGLKTPVNITFQRPNGALLSVVPQASSEPGVLEVNLQETTDLSIDKNAMTIQESGSVFLN